MSIYLKIPNIKGSVNAKGYENWLSVNTLSNGLNRSVKAVIGQMHNREAALPHFSDMSLTKKHGLFVTATIPTKLSRQGYFSNRDTCL